MPPLAAKPEKLYGVPTVAAGRVREAGALICNCRVITGVYADPYWLPPILVLSCKVSATFPDAVAAVWNAIVNWVNPRGVWLELSKGCVDGFRLGLLP